MEAHLILYFSEQFELVHGYVDASPAVPRKAMILSQFANEQPENPADKCRCDFREPYRDLALRELKIAAKFPHSGRKF